MEANLTILVIVCITAIIVIDSIYGTYKKNNELKTYKAKAKKVNQSNLEEIVKLQNEQHKMIHHYQSAVWKNLDKIEELEDKLFKEKARSARLKYSREQYRLEKNKFKDEAKELRMELMRERQKNEEADVAILALSVDGKKVKKEKITNEYFNNK
jgi:phage protein D